MFFHFFAKFVLDLIEFMNSNILIFSFYVLFEHFIMKWPLFRDEHFIVNMSKHRNGRMGVKVESREMRKIN